MDLKVRVYNSINITHEISNKYKMQGKLQLTICRAPIYHMLPFFNQIHIAWALALSINIIFFFAETERYSSSRSGSHGAWI